MTRTVSSRTQIDALGDRLKRGSPTDADVRLLDQYRRSFAGAYETVVRTLREHLDVEPTGRPAKSTTSIIEKLRRETIRLTQIQDIAGCRIVVVGIVEQDEVVDAIQTWFPSAVVVDRREAPSHGYRAMHVIVRVEDRPIEVQVRSALQHLWAEVSEKVSDTIDPGVKYGLGSEELQEPLLVLSNFVGEVEKSQLASAEQERQLRELQGRLEKSADEEYLANVRLLLQKGLELRAEAETLTHEGIETVTKLMRDFMRILEDAEGAE